MKDPSAPPTWPMRPSTFVAGVSLVVAVILLFAFLLPPHSWTYLREGCFFLMIGMAICAYRLLRGSNSS